MIRAALLASVVLLAGCAVDPPARAPSYARPVQHFPEPWEEVKAPAPPPPPARVSSPATPPSSNPDSSGPDLVTIGATAVPSALVGAKLGADRAKASPPPLEPPGARPALAAGETETAVGSAAAAEGRAGTGFMARLRANSAMRAIAGLGGEEVAGATAAGGLARFMLRGVIVPLIAGVALYEFMKP